MSDDRDAVVARWLELTRTILPGMARAHRWPIQLDHCFMRVCLDQAMQGQWDRTVGRPAVRRMALADLQRAIAVAESIVADPALLPALNAESLAWRRRHT